MLHSPPTGCCSPCETRCRAGCRLHNPEFATLRQSPLTIGARIRIRIALPQRRPLPHAGRAARGLRTPTDGASCRAKRSSFNLQPRYRPARIPTLCHTPAPPAGSEALLVAVPATGGGLRTSIFFRGPADRTAGSQESTVLQGHLHILHEFCYNSVNPWVRRGQEFAAALRRQKPPLDFRETRTVVRGVNPQGPGRWPASLRCREESGRCPCCRDLRRQRVWQDEPRQCRRDNDGAGPVVANQRGTRG